MKKVRPTNFLVILILFVSSHLFSQGFVYEVPLDSIKQHVVDDPDYLLMLNNKSIYADSVLDIGDYFDLYYGSAYLEGYNPYFERTAAIAAYELLQEEKYKDAIEMCKSLITTNPGFLRPFYFMGIAYNMLGDTSTGRKYFERFYDFLSLPFYSGDGSCPDSAFVVRSIDDEYLIISELELSTSSQALIFEDDIPYDILYVTSDSDTTKREMYFNIAQPYLLGLNFSDDIEKQDGKKKRKNKRNN